MLYLAYIICFRKQMHNPNMVTLELSLAHHLVDWHPLELDFEYFHPDIWTLSLS